MCRLEFMKRLTTLTLTVFLLLLIGCGNSDKDKETVVGMSGLNAYKCNICGTISYNSYQNNQSYGGSYYYPIPFNDNQGRMLLLNSNQTIQMQLQSMSQQQVTVSGNTIPSYSGGGLMFNVELVTPGCYGVQQQYDPYSQYNQYDPYSQYNQYDPYSQYNPSTQYQNNCFY